MGRKSEDLNKCNQASRNRRTIHDRTSPNNDVNLDPPRSAASRCLPVTAGGW
jgi:hypothetical protein